MTTSNLRASIALAKTVIAQEPPGVKAEHWDEWQAWKAKADQAEVRLSSIANNNLLRSLLSRIESPLGLTLQLTSANFHVCILARACARHGERE